MSTGRGGLWLLLTCGLLGLAGCSPYQLAKQTMHYELNQFPRVTDGKAACRQYKRWAVQEWSEICGETGEAWSDDYQSGFLQGFVDHVYAGGRVAAPLMPPRRYWRLPYRNSQGQQAIRDWYAGFEHGARVADEKGYRDRAVIPSSLLAGMPTSVSNEGEEIVPRGAVEIETGLEPPYDVPAATPATRDEHDLPAPALVEPLAAAPLDVSSDHLTLPPSDQPVPIRASAQATRADSHGQLALALDDQLPLPDDGSRPPVPTERPEKAAVIATSEAIEAIEAIDKGGVTLAAAVSDAVDEETSADALPLPQDHEAPPHPPWHGRRQASNDFDPFEGTRFEELSRSRSADESRAAAPTPRTEPRETAPERPPVVSRRHQMASAVTPAEQPSASTPAETPATAEETVKEAAQPSSVGEWRAVEQDEKTKAEWKSKSKPEVGPK